MYSFFMWFSFPLLFKLKLFCVIVWSFSLHVKMYVEGGKIDSQTIGIKVMYIDLDQFD